MDSKPPPDILRRPLYLYDLPSEVLSSLVPKTDADTQEDVLPSLPKESPQAAGDSLVGGAQTCSLCNLAFVTVQEQRGHLKSDLHHFNLKQKLRGAQPVTEAEFERLIGDLDESLSGSEASESDEEDGAERRDTTLASLLRKQAALAEKSGATGNGESDAGGELGKKRGTGTPPLQWFSSSTLPENTYFGIYRVVFTSKELAREESIIEAVKSRQLAPIAMPKPPKDGAAIPASYQGRHIFLCMIGGGHFAAMVVSLAPRQTKHGGSGPLNREATVLAHKTFHRYTTRRKQGGSQSANDAAKGAAHSAGASLRRYNEQALVDDIRTLLKDWKGLLDTSDLLFVRATGNTNRRTLFGPYDGQVLWANDPRIRGFPFSTRRATQNELMRSFIELTRLKVREIIPAAPTAPEPSVKPTATKPKPAVPSLSEEEENALLHTSQLLALIRRSKLPVLLSYLKNNDLPPDFRFHPPDANHHAPTPLHFAAAQNSAPMVGGLLGRGGADPTIKNGEGKTAFELAGDRATRDAFRVARDELGESRWDWEAAKIPAALKKEEADRRDERERKEAARKEAERRRAEEERLRTEGPRVSDAKPKVSLLAKLPPKTAQEVREEEARGLAPEQRLRLERERRARAAEERMRKMQT